MKFRRRLAFQLTPLLDLLLIVIFAQFLEVQATSEVVAIEKKKAVADMATAVEKREFAEDRLQQFHDELKRLKQRLRETEITLNLQRQQQTETETLFLQLTEDQQATLKTLRERDTKITQLQSVLNQVHNREGRMSEMMSELFQVPPSLIEEIVKPRDSALVPRSEEEESRLKARFASFAEANSREILLQLLAFDELQKRADIWEIHLDGKGTSTLGISKQDFEFRAATATEFQAKLFERYKVLPQPKALVIIMLSFADDVRVGALKAALEGLPLAAERMTADSDGRTRFEYTVVGFYDRAPRSKPTEPAGPGPQNPIPESSDDGTTNPPEKGTEPEIETEIDTEKPNTEKGDREESETVNPSDGKTPEKDHTNTEGVDGDSSEQPDDGPSPLKTTGNSEGGVTSGAETGTLPTEDSAGDGTPPESPAVPGP